MLRPNNLITRRDLTMASTAIYTYKSNENRFFSIKHNYEQCSTGLLVLIILNIDGSMFD